MTDHLWLVALLILAAIIAGAVGTGFARVKQWLEALVGLGASYLAAYLAFYVLTH